MRCPSVTEGVSYLLREHNTLQAAPANPRNQQGFSSLFLLPPKMQLRARAPQPYHQTNPSPSQRKLQHEHYLPSGTEAQIPLDEVVPMATAQTSRAEENPLGRGESSSQPALSFLWTDGHYVPVILLTCAHHKLSKCHGAAARAAIPRTESTGSDRNLTGLM